MGVEVGSAESAEVLFFLENRHEAILEVKLNCLDSEAPKSHKYHWLHYDRKTKAFTKLNFLSMSTQGERQYREFEQGELEFGPTDGRARLWIDDELGDVGLRRVVLPAPPPAAALDILRAAESHCMDLIAGY